MLTSIKLGNFKAFGPTQTIPIKPITLIFGPNSAGKSSFIHSLLVLHQAAVVDGNLDVHCPKLAGNSVDLGGFSEYVHRHVLDSSVSWELEFETSVLHGRLAELLKKHATTLQVAMQMGLRQEECKELRLVKNPKTGKEEEQSVPTGELRPVGKPYVKSYEIRLDGKPVLTLSARLNRVMSIDRVDVRSALINSSLRDCFSGQSRLSGLEDVTDEQLEVAVNEMLKSLSTRVDRLVPSFVGKRGLEDREEHLFRASPEVLFYGGVFTSGRLVGAINEQFVWLMDGLLEAAQEAITQTLGRLQYLGPLRTIPPRNFTTSEAHDANWMSGGAFAWQAVKEDAELREKVNGWLGGKDRLSTGYRLEVRKLLDASSLNRNVSQSIYDFDIRSRSTVLGDIEELLASSSIPAEERARILGELDNRNQDRVAKEEVEDFDNIKEMDALVESATSMLPGLDQLQLIDTNNDTVVSHRDVGIGISQALPVLVSAFASRNQMIAIEQPEIHVHPKIQAELADVFIEAALKEGGQKNTFILETHSEHLILRILRRIRETSSGSYLDAALDAQDETALDGHVPITPNDVSVFYVLPTPKGAQVIELPVTDEGDFSQRWPGGFFAERFQDLP
jgi:AAA15 family ATPase/GTPase